ncbi:hypothetical protein KAR29_09560 [Aminithiophilus ramosus]|uniref:DUF6922 domain-containing protein n=1 Tax=Aminithiophilus ramosus TaxID=3029084 RepID=A0A9Q7AME4_9BACT|nr:hypothetical protein [Aminithiophilus ramosus]QTX31607.1 hypothetical protein KAR29_09560 [Aminithiophilus ramosus]
MTDGGPLPESFRPLFWDVDWEQLDGGRHWRLIVERALNWGDEGHLRWIVDRYGRQKIATVVRESRRLTPKTARCWQNLFGLDEGEMRCFGTFSTSRDGYF